MSIRTVSIAMLLAACRSPSEEPAKAVFAPPPLAVTAPFPNKRATVAKPAPPAVGDTVIVVRDGTLGGAVRMNNVIKTWDSADSWECVLEVLAVEGGKVTKRRATFREQKHVQRDDNGKVMPWKPTVRGHSYVVEGDAITREDDATVTDEEMSLVSSAIGEESTTVEDVILGKPIESGKVIALPLDRAAKMVAPGVTLRTAELQLTDVRGDVATFELHLIGDAPSKVGRRAFETRDLSEWSIAKGVSLKVKGAAILTGSEGDGIDSWNHTAGTITYKYGP